MNKVAGILDARAVIVMSVYLVVATRCTDDTEWWKWTYGWIGSYSTYLFMLLVLADFMVARKDPSVYRLVCSDSSVFFYSLLSSVPFVGAVMSMHLSLLFFVVAYNCIAIDTGDMHSLSRRAMLALLGMVPILVLPSAPLLFISVTGLGVILVLLSLSISTLSILTTSSPNGPRLNLSQTNSKTDMAFTSVNCLVALAIFGVSMSIIYMQTLTYGQLQVIYAAFTLSALSMAIAYKLDIDPKVYACTRTQSVVCGALVLCSSSYTIDVLALYTIVPFVFYRL